MRKQITLMLMVALLCLCATNNATMVAQPTISNGDMPAIGESYSIRVVRSEGEDLLISQGPAGPDLTWSFTNLMPNEEDQHTVHFRSPEDTPHAATFETANYAMEYVPPVQIGTPKTQFHFFNNSTEVLDELGRVYAASDNQTGSILSFTDALKWLNYDWTYQDQLQDNFECAYTVSGTELKREGQTVAQADGYGSLSLPYGRFDNVLRLKITTTYQDQVVGSPTAFNYKEESYVWISPKYAMPLLTLFTEEVEGSPGNVLTVIYIEEPSLADEVVGVKEAIAITSDVQLMPNPAQDFVHLQYHLTEAAATQINVFNEVGQLVKSVQQPKQGVGRFQNTIDVQGFPQGLYLVELWAGTERIVEKVLVQ